ncbi:hypothetical protein [Sphingomonas oligophenolica]|uniref:DUF600 family protein n=1 Tax=Sphingomonas oligophenolica TaxID=301154 RepID=A0A502CK46_9SPHN|nr:hypothetical protein [Sphingomonas oligophenolica]TPG12136.1 hypothetical protein EAH84_10340 [Sphingomonas oligophenolica]
MTDTEPFEKILSDIAGMTAVDIEAGPDGAFLYAEAESMVVTAAIFKELPDKVIYNGGSVELALRILDAWDAAPDDRKWNALFMTIEGDRFDARFQYDEGWNPDEYSSDRRDRVLTAKYGDKPVDWSESSAHPRDDGTSFGWSGTVGPDIAN